MTSSPRLSILLPARNAGRTLESCLASIERQTERAWECVVVDDGSTDATPDIVRAAARRDSRFTLLSTPARGLVAALNTGVARCVAPLIARMDADDVMRRDRLRVQADALDRDPGLSAAGSHVRLFPRAAVSPRLREYEAWLNGLRSPEDVARDAFVECPIAHPTLLMRRELAELRYEDHGWPEDYDLLLRALAAGLRIGVVPRRLLGWRKGPLTLSRTDARYGHDRFTACKAHFLVAGILRDAEDYILCGYGSTGRSLRRALVALGRRPSHIVEIKRGRLGQRIHGAEVVPYPALEGLKGRPIVVSVARQGPRAEVREVLATMGFVECRDYVCAA